MPREHFKEKTPTCLLKSWKSLDPWFVKKKDTEDSNQRQGTQRNAVYNAGPLKEAMDAAEPVQVRH